MSAQHTRHHDDPIDWLLGPPPEPVIPRHSMLPPDPGRHRAPRTRRTKRHIDWARIIGTTATVIVTLGGWTAAAIQTHHLHQAQADEVAAMNDRTDLQSQVQQACANSVSALDLIEWIPVCKTVMPTTAPEDLDR